MFKTEKLQVSDMNLRIFQAIKRQKNADRWASVARWAAQKYVENGGSGYLDAYNDAQSKASHFYRSARVILGIEKARFLSE